MKLKSIQIKEHYSKLEENFLEISKQYNFAKFLKECSKKENLNVFFDSKDYFVLVKDYWKAENFEIRINKEHKTDFDDYEIKKICYFDFFMNAGFEGKRFPVYLRDKNFFKNDMNLIYSNTFSHEEREHQIHWTEESEREIVSHPDSLQKIISYFVNLKLEPKILNSLQEKILNLRKENPEKNSLDRRVVI